MDKQTLLLDIAHKAYQYYMARNRHSTISENEYVDVFVEGYKANGIVNDVQEKIAEKELDRLAKDFARIGHNQYDDTAYTSFKAGYLKAKQE